MGKLAQMTISGDVNGRCVVEESRPDGRLVLAPEWPSETTSIAAIRKRTLTRATTPEEFDGHFGELPTDGEG